MQSLRLVGPGEDGESVVLESLDGADRFSLPLDERLRDVSQAQPPESGPAPERSPAGHPLSPREIQTRVRAGESAETVAESSGMPLEKVMRFAFPVLAERSRVVDEARRARARRGDGHSAEFGELIDDRLNRHGVDPTTVGWDAFRRPDGGWTVTAAFTANEDELRPKFTFGLGNRTVSALDALAADLLSDRPVRALLPPDPDPVSEVEPAPVRLAAVPDPLDEDPDEPGIAASPAVRGGRRQKAHTRPIPIDADDELFDQEAFDVPAGQPHAQPRQEQPWQEQSLPFSFDPGDAVAGDAIPAVPGGPATSGTTTGGTTTDDPTAAAEPDPHEPAAQEPAAEQPRQPQQDHSEAPQRRGRRGEKPRMPSWDDILLGVRNKSD